MPDKYYLRTKSEDNCVYLWDFDKCRWQKLCDVDEADIPRSIREGLKDDLEKEQTELMLLKSIKI